MKLSKKAKFMLFISLIILNIILRFQVVPNEIFPDSVIIHIITNSLTEFGYAKWVLHPLSIFGLYPLSECSAVPFFLSGITQTTGMEMRWVIFLYCVFIGILSMFTAYLMAGELIDNDVFKILVAFGFSTSPAVLGYTTWTIPLRGLLVVLAPLLIYLLLKCHTSVKYIPLTVIFAILLFATHHLFYFLIPAFFAFFILSACFKLHKHFRNIKIPGKLTPFIPITGFFAMFSIPFFTGRFIEYSRYAPINESYVRYIEILIIFAVGGLAYIILKHKKSFGEWFLLLTIIILTTFIYEQTYMKWFLIVFTIPLAGIGLINVIKVSKKRKYMLPTIVIFLLLALCFSAYYQFIHFLPKLETNSIHERYMEESTYKAGRWMKEYIVNGSAIANDMLFGNRIFAAAETTHLLVPYGMIDQIYGFINVNTSKFKRYPITSEEFWFSGYEGPAFGEMAWESVHKGGSLQKFNIAYMIENRRTKGEVVWHHSSRPVMLLKLAYDEKDCIYNSGNIRIWNVNQL